MPANFLQVNDSKAEVLFFGQVDPFNNLNKHLGPLASNLHTEAQNLRVLGNLIFDSYLKFEIQIKAVVTGGFFQLRLIAKLKLLKMFCLLTI